MDVVVNAGDSHQSHFVQVLSSGGSHAEDMTVRLFTNVEGTRVVNLSQMPLILYAEVKRGNSPVLGADVVALINGEWSVSLLDSGNGGEKAGLKKIFSFIECHLFICEQ